MIKISVIIPIHRVEASYLNQCLSSLRKQTLKEFEAILILNDSTNGEKELSEKFCTENSRFKLFQTNVADVSTARNIGLEHAQGKYITFLDCDDWFSDNALQALSDLMEQNQTEIGIANTQKIWDNGKKTNSIQISQPHRRRFTKAHSKCRCLWIRFKKRNHTKKSNSLSRRSKALRRPSFFL